MPGGEVGVERGREVGAGGGGGETAVALASDDLRDAAAGSDPGATPSISMTSTVLGGAGRARAGVRRWRRGVGVSRSRHSRLQ